MKTILHWLVLSGAVYGIAYFFPDIVVDPWWIALLVGAVLFFINTIVKPIIKILTLPITLVTFGLFSLVLNVFFFWLPSKFIDGFQIMNLKAAIIGAIAVSVLNWFFEKVSGK
ncbi:MAG TPA: phage holin family protein [Candidatus Paceibacterota bacterium]|nr:phage holin family protein [Candidatus Paceibacterota bacterium]